VAPLFRVRHPELLLKAAEHFTRVVGQQSVPADSLASVELPLPPLKEQKRIVAILKEGMATVKAASVGAGERLKAIQALPSALLRRAFAGEL